jgi:hypothetical protein
MSASNAFLKSSTQRSPPGNVGLIRGFPNGLGILQGELIPVPIFALRFCDFFAASVKILG